MAGLEHAPDNDMKLIRAVSIWAILTSLSAPSFAAPLCRNLFVSTLNIELTEQKITELVGNAKSYQDKRNKDWSDRNKCLCCHTTLPYMLARGLDAGSKVNFDKLKDLTVERVENQESRPWYHGDQAGRDSKPTESVLNALTLLMHDLSSQLPLQATTLKAVDSIFAKLETNGRLHWLDFNLQPFESKKGELWGNSMALLAVEIAKKHSGYEPPVDKYAKLKAFVFSKKIQLKTQEMAVLLWANSQGVPGKFLSSELSSQFINGIIEAQSPNGSVYQKAALGYGKREENVYATAISLIGMIKAGYGNHPAAHKAAKWLADKQAIGNFLQMGDATVLWNAASMNRTGSLLNDRFASDYSTSYASLALSMYQAEVFQIRP